RPWLRRVGGDGEKMTVADAAAGKGNRAHRLRQKALRNGRGSLGGVEGEGNVGLPVREQLPGGRTALREAFSRSPEMRVQRVEIGPEGCGRRRKTVFLKRLLHDRRGVGIEFEQRLFQESGAEKIRRLGIGQPSRM